MAITRQPVQAMLAQATVLWHVGMLEGPRCPHAKTLHDAARPDIAQSGERHNFAQAEQFKTNAQGASCSFRREPLAPMPNSKTPPDLHAWGKREFSGWRVEADKPNELLGGSGFRRPETPAAFFDERLAAISHCITLHAREWRGEELHDLRIGIEHGEGFAVRGLPLTQAKALGLELDEICHFLRCSAMVMQEV